MIIILHNLFIKTLGPLVIFVLYDWNTSNKLSHIFEKNLLVDGSFRDFENDHELYHY